MLFSLFLLVAFWQPTIEELPDAKTIISKSIAYHDPDNHWDNLQAHINFVETRPNGSDRNTSVEIDNKKGTFCITRIVEEKSVERHIVNDSCTYMVDDQKYFSSEQIEKYRLQDERSFLLRNYYVYLWGLPMKLNDQGAIINNEVKQITYDNKDAYEVKVTYDENTGSDTWYFYFSPDNYALIGYKFYHANGEGEFITLKDIETVQGIKIPKERSWYTIKDSEFLGKDTLESSNNTLHGHS